MSQKKIKTKKRKFHPQAIRHAKDVDLSKADPNCKRCDGSGMLDAIKPDSTMKKGGIDEPVPVVCRCVTRGGGVTVHPLMKWMTALRDQLKSGEWAKSQIDDLQKMTPLNRQRALAQLKQMRENDKQDKDFQAAIEDVLAATKEEVNA